MRWSSLGLFLTGLAFWACESSEEIIGPASEPLVLSSDTIFFDTLLSNLESYTLRLQAKNPNRNAIIIDRLALGNGENSAFKMLVNGEDDAAQEDLTLLGGDSLLVLLSVKRESTGQDAPLHLQDGLQFQYGSNEETVTLLAFGQDVSIFRQDTLKANTTWLSGKPYFIDDYLVVNPEVNLTISEGTEVYFGFNAALVVEGSLNVEGSAPKPVRFLNSRLDEPYDQLPGQWFGIFMERNSGPHRLAGADIRNSSFGIIYNGNEVGETPDLELSQVRIENVSEAAIFADSINLVMSNVLVNHAIGNCLNLFGGVAQVDHCTFANLGLVFGNSASALALFSETESGTKVSPAGFSFRNCVVTGALADEVGIQRLDLDLTFESCLLQTSLDRFSEFSTLGQDNLLREDPLFVDPAAYNYRPAEDSPLRNAGLNLSYPADLLGFERDVQPDIGALEFQMVEE